MHNWYASFLGFFSIKTFFHLNIKAFAVGKCPKLGQPRNVALHTCHIQVVGHCESTSQRVNRHEVMWWEENRYEVMWWRLQPETEELITNNQRLSLPTLIFVYTCNFLLYLIADSFGTNQGELFCLILSPVM